MNKTEQYLRAWARKVITNFLQGLLLMAPVFFTLYSVYAIFDWLDSKTNSVFEYLFGFHFPALGILVMVALVTIIGYIGSLVFLQPLLDAIGGLLERAPIIRDVYSSVKDFFEAFLSNKKKFTKPAMVEMGKGLGIYRLGFITDNDLSDFHLKDKVAVYMPMSYSFAGDLYLVNRDQVQPLDDVSPSDAMKYMVSGGVMQIEDDEEKSGSKQQ